MNEAIFEEKEIPLETQWIASGTAAIKESNPAAEPELKCEICKHKKGYTTGRDEYPAMTYLQYCAKGHWDCSPEPEPGNNDVWGDCVDYESSTPPAEVPEQGEFERAVFKIIYENDEPPVASEIVMMLAAAHNRDMAEARKRIAVLEAELKRSNIKAASNYRAFCDEQERRSKDEAAFQEYRGSLEAENARLRADKAELQAQVPKTVIPVNVLKGHMVNEYPVLSWTCPVCGQTKHKMARELHEVVIGDPACGSCGAKLDWSKEEA